jgi:hypothetical protein
VSPGSIARRVSYAGDRGQILPLVAVVLVVLFGAAALAVDVGYMRYKQRIQQSATDSAAIAAALEDVYLVAAAGGTTCTVSTSGNATMTAAAQKDSALNGFTDDSGTTVSVNASASPASGGYAGNPCAVEADIIATHDTFFSKIFGSANPLGKVSTRAVALLENGGQNCVIALDSSGNGLIMNSSTIDAPNCGFMSNGKLSMNGGTSATAAAIGAVGKISDQNGTFPEAQPQNAVAVTDPCRTIAGCAYLANYTPPTTPCLSVPAATNGTVYINSQTGVYCSGMDLSSETVVFGPGLYVIDGDLKTNNNSVITGSGVTFYMATGSINMNNISSLNLSAPATGSTEGMLFYQPPSNTSTDTINSSQGTLSGIIYAPTAQLNINASFNSYFQLIAGSVNMSQSTVDIPPGGAQTPGEWHVSLAE